MDKFPSEISKLDRIWMSLAAYNLGYKNIELARDLAKSGSLNPNLWSEVSMALEVILVDRYGEESREFVKYIYPNPSINVMSVLLTNPSLFQSFSKYSVFTGLF